MAGKAGIAYVEIKFSPGDLARMMAESKAAGREIANDTSNEINKNGGIWKSLLSNWKLLVPAIVAASVALLGFTGNFAALAPLIPIVTIALTAALVPFTTLAAVLVGFIPPLTLIAGLLGGLGVAFGLAGARALKGGGIFKDFAKTVSQVTGAFHDLIYTLAGRFLPIFNFLATSARDALRYLGQIAKLPLKQAFQSLATTGVAGFQKFLDKIGSFLKKPITLAVGIAFGKRGGEIRSALADDWNDIVKFFTSRKIALPVERWFGRQDFTKIGYRWGAELAGAIVKAMIAVIQHVWNSGRGGKMILGGAAAGAALGTYLGGPIGGAMGLAIGAGIGAVLNHYWPKIAADASKAFHVIGSLLKRAIGPTLWGDLIRLAKSFWDTLRAIGGYLQNHVYPVVKHVFEQLGGWRTVSLVIVGVIRLMVVGLVLTLSAVRAVYNALQTVVHWIQRAANLANGALQGAWSGVLAAVGAVSNAISTIVDGIRTAVGLAQQLANALSSGLGGSPGSGGQGGAPSTGKGHTGGTGHHAVGGIFTRPTMIGNDLFGEAGREAVLPLDSASGHAALTDAIRAAMGGIGFNFYLDGKLIDARVEARDKRTARTMTAGRKWATA